LCFGVEYQKYPKLAVDLPWYFVFNANLQVIPIDYTQLMKHARPHLDTNVPEIILAAIFDNGKRYTK